MSKKPASRARRKRAPDSKTRKAKTTPEQGTRPKDPPTLSETPQGGPGGRPTKYREEFVPIAMAMCQAGATDFDLAQEFEVAPSTISLWQAKHQAFAEAVRIGKEAADARVERSLYQRAVGYTYEAEKIFNNQGEVTRATVVEHVPPDVGACKLWLTNRQPEAWREKNEHNIKVQDLTPQHIDDEHLMALLAPYLGPTPYEAAKAEKELSPPKGNGTGG